MLYSPRLLSILIFGLLAHTALSAQQGSDTIPFTLSSQNNLVVPVVFNGQDTALLMLHTAASGLNVIKEASTGLPSLQFDRVDTLRSWGGSADARVSTDNELRIGGQVFTGQTIWEDEHSGPGTDGKFGINLFQGKVLEINYDRQLIIVHSTLPAVAMTYEKSVLEGEPGRYFLRAVSVIDGVKVENRFLVHTGYGGNILFDDGFAASYDLEEQLSITDTQELKDAFGNVIKVQKALLPELRVGTIAVSDVEVGFFSGKIGRQQMSVLGAGILKRFNVVFDLRQEPVLYLQKRS